MLSGNCKDISSLWQPDFKKTREKIQPKGHDTYTNSTVESGLVCICVMHYDWIVGPYSRLNRRVGNNEKLKINN